MDEPDDYELNDNPESIDKPESNDERTEPTEKKKGKKGMRATRVMTPEKLEILRLAREKALEVRKQNALTSGRAAKREQIKKNAIENKKKYEDHFNKRVEDEIQKRMQTMSLDNNLSKIDELVNAKLEAKLAEIKPTKKSSKKKVILEESDSSSEEEVIVRRRQKKVIIKETPAPPAPPPVVKQEVAPPEPTPEEIHRMNFLNFTNQLNTTNRFRVPRF